jgi:hypothetical protein
VEALYDLDWRLLLVSIKVPRAPERNPARPPLTPMLAIFERLLAAPFVHVRVEWFVVDPERRFGGTPFFRAADIERFSPSGRAGA